MKLVVVDGEVAGCLIAWLFSRCSGVAFLLQLSRKTNDKTCGEECKCRYGDSESFKVDHVR